MQKNWSKTAQIWHKIVYIIFVQNVWICRKIDCLELRKFNGKLCTLNVRKVRIYREIEYPKLRKLNKRFCSLFLNEMSIFAKKLNIWNSENSTGNCIHYIYIYKMSGFVEKLNLHNYENSTGNYLHYICSKFLDLQKNWISRTGEIQQEIVYVICT